MSENNVKENTNEGFNYLKLIKILIVLVIVFVNFKLVTLNKGYYNGQPLGGLPTNRYVNHGALYNILGQNRIIVSLVLAVLTTGLTSLTYLKELKQMDKKKAITKLVILFVCIFALDVLFIHFPMPSYV